MKRSTRIALEIFGPPAIGSMSLLVLAAPGSLSEIFYAAAMFLLFGFYFALIPSVVYMLLMESFIGSVRPPESWWCVVFSTAMGWCAGGAISAFVDGAPSLVMDGIWTGLVMGLLLKGLTHWGERRSLASSSEQSEIP
jgi:RsiW-degrading membrane proteinase PrsW (M82 family)